MHTPTTTAHRGNGRRVIPCLLAASAIAAFAADVSALDVAADIADASPAWANAQQMILVVTADWNADHGMLRRFERGAGDWRGVGDAVAVTVGRAGAAWGLGLHATQSDGPIKREGDGRAPAGVFALGNAFGYAERTLPHLRYDAMQATHHCIDVPDSPLYNRIVDAREVGADAIAGSTEPMRRDLHVDGEQTYRLGLVIAHNAGNIASAGSCIFAHVWRAPGVPTAGCTAMADADMTTLLEWIDPARDPVFVLLPEMEYRRLQPAWRLPSLPKAAP